MKKIKFRVWDGVQMISPDYIDREGMAWWNENSIPTVSGLIMQFTGLHDKNGIQIYEGDILEFAYKWEWYKGSYGIKMRFAEPERRAELQKQYDAEPMERREIQMPECYEWILSSEIQTYWQVIGNIHQNPDLLK